MNSSGVQLGLVFPPPGSIVKKPASIWAIVLASLNFAPRLLSRQSWESMPTKLMADDWELLDIPLPEKQLSA